MADLEAEQRALDELVAGLDEAGWDTPTPAEGWAVRDQVSHLAFFDERATLAATDQAGFRSELERVLADPSGIAGWDLELGRRLRGGELLGAWRRARASLLEALGRLGPRDRLPWYGPSMGAASFVTARLMETWAHGQDVADALGVEREPTARLRHVAHLGVLTRGWSYTVRGLAPPDVPVRVELEAPGGGTWTWGAADAADRVAGPALDFCLVVTQRRHVADTGLRVDGPHAREWMSIAQAFAGPPGPGRPPGAFRR